LFSTLPSFKVRQQIIFRNGKARRTTVYNDPYRLAVRFAEDMNPEYAAK
jgi:hypothetical protein